MPRAAKLLAATAVLAALALPALAADVVVVPPPAPPPPVAEPTFVGPYWGVFGGYWSGVIVGAAQFSGPTVGTQFGYSIAASPNLRIGLEVETEYFRVISTRVDASLSGRVGLVVGNNDNILIYGQAGLGTLTPGLATWNAGGGVEFLLNPNLSLFVEGKAYFGLLAGGFLAWTVRGGVNYYADRSNLDAGGDFDWGGMYMGGFLGYTTAFVPAAPPPWGIGGVQVGYNFGNGGPLVFGAEVETAVIFPFTGPNVQASLNARAGLALGNFLVYGEAGIGTYNVANPVYTAGGGVEIALGEKLGLFAEAEAVFGFGGGGFAGWHATGGFNVHFGR